MRLFFIILLHRTGKSNRFVKTKGVLILFPRLKAKNCAVIIAGSTFLAFGLYHVHSISAVTEGGVLGLTLLLDHWLNITPAVSGFLMNACCFLVGWKLLGREFIGYSAVSAAAFSAAYWICEHFPPLWPGLSDMPLAASVLGALFVGIGTGVCVRAGGATSGDDALAMSISHVTGVRIQWVYLVSDLTVLGLSLTYIPLGRIAYSLLTVVLSGQIIGLIQNFHRQKK